MTGNMRNQLWPRDFCALSVNRAEVYGIFSLCGKIELAIRARNQFLLIRDPADLGAICA